MNNLQFHMKKSFALLMSLLLVFSMFVPAVEAIEQTVEQEQVDVTTIIDTDDQGINNELADNDQSLPEVQDVGQEVPTSDARIAEVRTKVEQALDKSKQYYKDIRPNGAISHSDYWLFSALWGADINLKAFPWAENKSPWEKDTFWTKGKESATSTSNEDAGIIIGSILLGQDPHKFGERDIVRDLMGKQKDNGSFFTIWGESWAMIALDLVDAAYDREKHIEYMLAQQSNGTFGGVDSNGWILTALAPYMDERRDVKEAIELAVQAVHDGYQKTGDISDNWGANSNSTSAALMGLAAVGEDLFSDKWTKDEKNIVEQFIDTYQQEDGSFWWQANTAGAISMATEQSLLALATITQGESIFVRLKEHKKDVVEQTTKVSLRVEGINDTLYLEDGLPVVTSIAEATAFDATEQGLNKAGISYEGSSSFISKIADEDTATFGGWDGWQFMVNDAYPSVGAGDYPVKDGDKVVWFYGNVGDIYKGEPSADEVEKLTLNPKITVASELYAGNEIEVSVTAEYNVYNENFGLEQENVETPVKDANVHFNGENYKTDESGIARISGEKAKVGSYEIRITKDIEGSYPRLLRQAKKIIIEEEPEQGTDVTVQLQIEGISGSVLGKQKVKVLGQKTALDLLKKELDQAKIDYVIEETEWGAYLKAIAGEEAGHFGGYDGWQFIVNGISPIIGAGDYLVKDGDHVVWFYGNSGDIYKGDSSADEVEKLTLNPEVAISSVLYAGDEIEVSVTAKYNVYNESYELEEENVETPIKHADIHFNGENYKTDENGIARIPGEKARVGSYELKVTKDIENSYPRLLRQAKKIIIDEQPGNGGGSGGGPATKEVTLSIEKRSIGEDDIIKPTEVTLQSGDTAFTLMKRIAEQRKISLKYTGSDASLYVQAIDGLGEFDKGSESGWMYSVNGIYPEQSAGKYNLKDGDVLRWRYTTDLGHDIGGNIPDEDGSGGSSGGGGGSSTTPTPKPETSEVSVPVNKPFTLDEKYQKEIATSVILNFGEKNVKLPKITAPRGNTLLEIVQGTKVTSDWDGKIQVPTSLISTEKDLEKINEVLSIDGKETAEVDLRIKVGGAKKIIFDQHVTLSFKDKGAFEAGLIDVDGNFSLIKRSSSANTTDDVYSYLNGDDLIIKTNHFTEFLLFKSTVVGKPETPVNPIEFTDVTDHWAKDFIQQAAQLGIVKGYADGSFKPDSNLTRVQAVSVLVRALSLETDESAPFKDIGSYAKETQAEIAAAYKHGLVTKQDGNFNPSNNVTRAQMALMLHRAYEQKTGVKYIASEKSPYTDFGNYNNETINAISMLYELDIATGSDGKYMPGNATTRAHVAKMLINFLDELK